jgi:UDP-N-acetylglucosamine:LPS N-acetylglucosamine transferase
MDTQISPKILAVASKGGHWQQMMALSPAFLDGNVTFAATDPGLSEDVPGQRFVVLQDYSRTTKLKLLSGLVETFWTVARSRPNVVISPGAAPGLFCILWGRILGARCIWVDSIANGERLSLSGRLACRISHIVLTQWEHLAEADDRLDYWGSVI